jgi:alkylation response protein AidB-like acyl-CoA dehydrogenase
VATEVEPHGAEWERRQRVPGELFRSFAAAGLLALGYPREVGGGGQGFVDQLVVAEELYYSGWGGVALSLLGHAGIALQPLLLLGSDAQKERYLLPALRGESLTALAVTERQAGSDVGGLVTSAEPVAAGWRLNGTKVFVTLGDQADVVLVAARISGRPGHQGVSLFLVPGDSDGLVVLRSMDKLGMRSSNTAEIRFADCLLPHDALLGGEGTGFKAVMRQFQAERLILAVGALAMGRRAVDEAIAYLRGRSQFGRPLSSYQALRHRIADAASSLEALRTFVFATGAGYDRGAYPVTEISMAKLLSARAGFEAVDDMLQMFGGWGYVTDHPLERIWRDVRLLRIGGGTDEIMREVIARRLGLDAPEGAGTT